MWKFKKLKNPFLSKVEINRPLTLILYIQATVWHKFYKPINTAKVMLLGATSGNKNFVKFGRLAIQGMRLKDLVG